MTPTKTLELYAFMGVATLGASALPLIASTFVINYGRLFLFLYRYVSPIAAVLWMTSAIPNLLGAVSPGTTVQGIFHHLWTTALWGTLYLVFWAVTSFLTVGPPWLFLRLSEIQYKTTLRWKFRKGGVHNMLVLNWFYMDEQRTRDRRAWAARTFAMPFLAPHIVRRKKSEALEAQVVGREHSAPRWDRERMENLFAENNARTQERYREESNQKREEVNNLANGRINWRPLGKQYKPNPYAFKKVYGMERVIDEIERSIIIPLQNPKLVREYNVSMNAGILLYGPPGTGKTELARAVAEHLGLYFIAVRPSDLNATLVGATEQNIAALFKEAKDYAPSIIFLDEIDSIGTKRGGSHQYHDEQLTQLLTELDGFEKREGVFVIAATNRLESLDEALTRGGRFGTKIEVPAPDQQTLWNMFHAWASPLHLDSDVYAVEVGMALDGHSGATVKMLVENLKHVEIQKRVSGKKGMITRDDVFAEIAKVSKISGTN